MKDHSYMKIQSATEINQRRRFIRCAAGAAAIFTLAGTRSQATSDSGKVFNIRDFGATGDGKTLDTAAIQKAINACAAAGGGQVLVSKESYVTGTIRMKEKIPLHLAKDAVLLGSTQLFDAHDVHVVGPKLGTKLGRGFSGEVASK